MTKGTICLYKIKYNLNINKTDKQYFQIKMTFIFPFLIFLTFIIIYNLSLDKK